MNWTQFWPKPEDETAAESTPVPVGDQPQPLDDTRLAEIAARVEAATPGPWGVYESGSMIDIAADLKETGCGYRARREIARLEDEPLDNDPTHREWTAEEDWAQVQADAEFIAHAPTDMAALLAEVQHLRAERHTTNEALSDAAEQPRANRDRIGELEENLRAVNAGWAVARARVAELERPAIEAKRDEVRQSYAELAAQCREDRDFEGAFNLECQLREREEQWKREDEGAAS